MIAALPKNPHSSPTTEKIKSVCLSGKKFNPLIGAAGISAFPMSARIVQKVGQEEDYENFLLMHAMGANTAGQLGSVIAGGVVLAIMSRVL